MFKYDTDTVKKGAILYIRKNWWSEKIEVILEYSLDDYDRSNYFVSHLRPKLFVIVLLFQKDQGEIATLEKPADNTFSSRVYYIRLSTDISIHLINISDNSARQAVSECVTDV